MKCVYPEYRDGQTWLHGGNRGSYGPWTMIPRWQWLAYRMFCWLDRKVGQWCCRLDNRAYSERDQREGRP